jgi:glycosyltransferase involved in cell wall biosynthesis
VAGDAALLVNPMEGVEIYEAMEALATRPELRGELRARGKIQSNTFSWEKSARKTLEAYRYVLRQGEEMI